MNLIIMRLRIFNSWQQAIYQLSGVTALTLAVGLAGCGGQSSEPLNQNQAASTSSESKPQVVATHSVLCDLTEKIAQDTINLNCLIEGGQDPHTYQATPEDRKAIETANLILYGGYDFDTSLIKLIEASKNAAPKVAVHEQAVSSPMMAEDHHHTEEEHAHEDEAKTQTQPEGAVAEVGEEMAPDPHIWHDAQNGIRMVEIVRDHLSKVAPANADLYTRNAQQLTAEIQQLNSWIKAQINTIPAAQRKLVTTHDALNYYAKAYGLTVEGALQGVSTDEEATAARVKELVTDVKQAKVPTIFAEQTANSRLIETLAREADVKVAQQELYVDGLGEAGTPGETYVGMLAANTCAIAQGLGGQCTPFQAKTP
jgi:manganese/iron transport system substrate-binding protein